MTGKEKANDYQQGLDNLRHFYGSHFQTDETGRYTRGIAPLTKINISQGQGKNYFNTSDDKLARALILLQNYFLARAEGSYQSGMTGAHDPHDSFDDYLTDLSPVSKGGRRIDPVRFADENFEVTEADKKELHRLVNALLKVHRN